MSGRLLRELGMGARMAFGGGRGGVTRTVLTAIGIGLGVAVLLLAASVPAIRAASDDRVDGRAPVFAGAGTEDDPPTGSVGLRYAETEFLGQRVSGAVLERIDVGAAPALPPGIDRLPKPGDLYVSPALARLLDGEHGELLAARFGGARVAGTIGNEGLAGPGEHRFYQGAVADAGESRVVTSFGDDRAANSLPPLFVMLIVVILVVLLLPVAVFVATAVRFGGESRDRRLAALRLVGADRAMTARITAGETLAGALLGLVSGVGIFYALRSVAAGITLFGNGAFATDITPVPALALPVLAAVPVSSVAVSLFALRSVAVTPLGVARDGAERPRRMWWRSVLLLGGALLLAFGASATDGGGETLVVLGMLAFLIGTALMVPWLMERLLRRLRGGPLSWQLAVRRLQLTGGSAARAVSGVTVAVAGAVALQMVFAGVDRDTRVGSDQDAEEVQFVASSRDTDTHAAAAFLTRYEGGTGVAASAGHYSARMVAAPGGPGAEFVPVRVGDCAALAQLVRTGSCADGDAFWVAGEVGPQPGTELVPYAEDPSTGEPLPPDPSAGGTLVVPETVAATMRVGADGNHRNGLFLTPGAVLGELPDRVDAEVFVALDPTVPAALEHVRSLGSLYDGTRSHERLGQVGDADLAAVSQWLAAGSTAVMLMIAASLIVSTVEQLRERRRQLAVLVAFGTRRRTLAASVLWQTAVPVGLGLVIAAVGGVSLGLLLVRLFGTEVVDWWALPPYLGVGLGMVAVVTSAGLPPLWRMMRPDGLRSE